MFITSAEDTSIGKHFVQAKVKCQIYTDITIRKEGVQTADSSDGAVLLKSERENLTRWLTANESNDKQSGTPQHHRRSWCYPAILTIKASRT